MWVAFHAFDTKRQFDHIFPRFVKFREEQPGHLIDESHFKLGQWPAKLGTRFFPAPKQPVEQRKDDRRIDIEDDIAFKRCGPQYVEAGWILQAKYEFAVSHLVHTDQSDVHHASDQSRK